MRLSINLRAFALAILSVFLLTVTASAAEVRVMISGGLTAAYKALVPEFERATGHKVLTAGRRWARRPTPFRCGSIGASLRTS